MSEAAAEPERFAAYLARCLIGRQGFGTMVPAEAAALIPACDHVFVRTDRQSFHIACIVDRDADPEAAFSLSPLAVRSIAQDCRALTRSGIGRAYPVWITIYEVGTGATAEDTTRRLADFKPLSTMSKARVAAVAVDPGRAQLWTNQPRSEWLGGYRWLRRLVAQPRRADAELAAVAPPRGGGMPWITLAILGGLIAVFAAEVRFALDPVDGTLGVSTRTLIAFGGVSHTLTFGLGEWWRLFTAPLLHLNLPHIVFNGLAFVLIGVLTERLVGAAWFAATFAVGAVAGSLLSIAVNAPNIVSVGASGAIVGLFAASLVVSFRFPAGRLRTKLQGRAVGTLTPALIPLFSADRHDAIDYGAHFGGAAGGLLMGGVMLALWRRDAVQPRLVPLAWAIAAAFAVAIGGAAVTDADNYRLMALTSELYTPFPTSDREAKALSSQIVAVKPRDPRGRVARALALADAGDLPNAEAQLRTALADPEMLRLVDPPHYADRVGILLALVFLDERRPSEAHAAAAAACAIEKTGPLRDVLDKAKLCA